MLSLTPSQLGSMQSATPHNPDAALSAHTSHPHALIKYLFALKTPHNSSLTILSEPQHFHINFIIKYFLAMNFFMTFFISLRKFPFTSY